jgi:hypothetical protein
VFHLLINPQGALLFANENGRDAILPEEARGDAEAMKLAGRADADDAQVLNLAWLLESPDNNFACCVPNKLLIFQADVIGAPPRCASKVLKNDEITGSPKVDWTQLLSHGLFARSHLIQFQ